MPVKFHIPDIARNFNFNMVLLMIMQEHPEMFRDGVQIASVYGEFPTSLWNGGVRAGGGFAPDDAEYVTKELNSRGIAVNFTYTNSLLNQSHLQDDWCRKCLHTADRPDRLNGVIVASPVLEKHLRAKYPNYRILASDAIAYDSFDALCEAMEKYDSVLIDYSLNAHPELLEKLPHKERAVLLVNCLCIPDCPRRKAHIQFLSRTQLAYSAHCNRFGPQAAFHNPETFACPYLEHTIYHAQKQPTFLSPDKVFDTLVPMGFEQFRIEGRWSSPLSNLESYVCYLAKPEARDELRLMYLLNLQQNGILRYDG